MTNRPNVLLITTDHWPGSLLGVAGHPAIQTPTLDQLTRCGIRYTNAYSECPVCIPARRTILTGVPPRSHGDRTFKVNEPLPDLPTIAQVFRDAGYQSSAVGKLHVYPPRDRAGFDDVILCEEGRPQMGATDDYEIYLGDQGYPGWQFLHGMSNNDYVHRPWHLPEQHHVTNWLTRQMCRTIQRRDPTRPGFWYLAYTHPHPPLAPLSCYLDMYRDVDPGEPDRGDWLGDADEMPRRMNNRLIPFEHYQPDFVRAARRAFYAQCTHIDHQIRLVLGTLREQGLLDQTVIMFSSDHGDMLGNHGLWAKRLFYEDSACVPMILSGVERCSRTGRNITDNRLVGWQDVMPTLLDLAGLEVPASVEGLSMIAADRRQHLYGEYGERDTATRMIHDGRFKLVYYAERNVRQLFDLAEDPRELTNLADSAEHDQTLERLTQILLGELYGSDLEWLDNGTLIGCSPGGIAPVDGRNLALQRGSHWPEPR